MRPLGGLVACSPRKFLYSMLDSDILGETQAGGGGGGGGNPSVPPLCM